LPVALPDGVVFCDGCAAPGVMAWASVFCFCRVARLASRSAIDLYCTKKTLTLLNSQKTRVCSPGSSFGPNWSALLAQPPTDASQGSAMVARSPLTLERFSSSWPASNAGSEPVGRAVVGDVVGVASVSAVVRPTK
jgi:hypothetical protein